MSWQLIKFLYLKSGRLFEAGGLFNFKRFRQVASSFYNKKWIITNMKKYIYSKFKERK